jgi:dephospho-CoA kinase
VDHSRAGRRRADDDRDADEEHGRRGAEKARVILHVGLTGGIGSGKSTVLRIFAGLGCITVDADAVVATLYRPGNAGHEAIVRTYGPSVLAEDGEIDRKKLSAIAFANSEEARRLNALIHPIVIAEESRIAIEEAERFPDEDRIFVVEATLLLEAGGKQRYDRIVVVDVEPEVQIARAVARGMDRVEVERRIANQLPREERLRHADYVIDNSGDEAAVEIETRRVYDLLLEDLARKKKASG